MHYGQIIKVWEVHQGAILRHADCGKVILCVVKNRPVLDPCDSSYSFSAKDLITGKIYEFSAKYPYTQYHPHLEYVGEAAGFHG